MNKHKKWTWVIFTVMISLAMFISPVHAEWSWVGDDVYTLGNVGIGTTAPGSLLHTYVSGASNLLNTQQTGAGNYYAAVKATGDDSDTAIFAFDDSYSGVAAYTGKGGMQVGGGNAFISAATAGADIEFYAGGTGAGNLAMFIADDGNVGIGITNPEYKLAVKGTIAASEIKVVDTSGWADFVFNDDYNLPSLETVESYIKKEKHLPDVPSAKEIEKDGLSMSAMMAKQMQKIEELTLYLIEMKKQNSDLLSRVAVLEGINSGKKMD